MKSEFHRVLNIVSVCVIPLLLLVFAIVYKVDEAFYMQLTEEDQLVEWLTFAFLLSSGGLAATLAFKMRKSSSPYIWFFVTFSVLCALFALDEISWGQRVVDVESPEFFLKHSDQKEINIHNVIQKRFNVKTKHIAARILFYYGTVLPILVYDRRIRKFIAKTRILVPPVSLSLGFLIAALLMWDRPTGREEELGELFFSICFVLFMASQFVRMRDEKQV